MKSTGLWMAAAACVSAAIAAARGGECMEPARTLPLIQDVDVVVVGGSCGAVAAAEAAAREGATVFLVTAGLALGDDVAGTLRLWAEPDEAASSDLMRRVFPADAAKAEARVYTTPLQAKKALDAALLKAGVRFLTGAYARDVLEDSQGRPAGVVISDRSGSQAVRAKVVIDATDRGHIARCAGALFTPFASGTCTFSRVVIAGEEPEGVRAVRHDGWSPAKDLVQLKNPESLTPRMYECSFEVAMPDGSARAFAEAAQVARDRTFVGKQLDGADLLHFIPSDRMKSAAPVQGEWPGAERIDLGALRPAGIDGIYVLGAMADVPRAAAAEIVRPANAILLGARVGRQAAVDAKRRGAAEGVRLRAAAHAAATPADIREVRGAMTHPFVAASGEVACGAHALPVLAETDVVVVGGGTTGAPAAIGAVQNGLRTILIEQIFELGGVQTAGLICGYYYGNVRGFTKEIDEGVAATGRVKAQAKAEWYRAAVRRGGGEIWFGSMAVGAVLEGTKLRGIVVVTPDGRRGVVLAQAVIDASGNADIAAAAGEPTEFYEPGELIGQGVGQAVVRLGSSSHNNDYAMVDDTDASDLCFFALRARGMTEGGWDLSPIVNSRERRRMVGVVRMTALDYLTGRTWPDTVVQHRSRFDLHGNPSGDFFHTKNIRTANHVTLDANAPYRALLPKTTDGLLVVGLGMSASRDAMAILRMQADLQNQGYAAAYAVRLALKSGCELRAIPVKDLQRHLVEKGIVPSGVLEEDDSHPVSDTMLRLATHDAMFGYGSVAFLFAAPDRARPLLADKYRELSTHSSGRSPEVSLIYAHLLAMLGDRTGEDELIEWVKAHDWADPWPEAMGSGLNRMESYILALARAGSRKAVPAIAGRGLALVETGKAPAASRFRALWMASMALADPGLAEMLAGLLALPGVTGHAIAYGPEIPPVPGYSSRSGYSQSEKSDTLRELNLAAALVRCGDKDGRGAAVLKAYAADPRGFYATYARQVLAEKPVRE